MTAADLSGADVAAALNRPLPTATKLLPRVPFHVPSLAELLREHDAMAHFPMDLWLAAAAQHGTEKAASLWDDAARHLLRTTPVTRLAQPHYEDLGDLAEAGFNDEGHSLLPGIYHRPAFDGLCTPNIWLCSICWGDAVLSQWPCAALTGNSRASVALAHHLGLEWSS